jgi:hypothetical protein
MRSLVVGLVILLAACSNKDNANATTDHKQEPPPPPKKAPPGVDLVVDGASAGRVTPDQVQNWVRVDTILPEDARRLGKWASLTLTANGKPIEITKPTERYPDKAPALFPAPDGTIAFGMFDAVELAKKGKPSYEQVGITKLEVKIATDTGHGGNDDGNAPPGDPMQTSVTVKTATGEVVLKGDKLLNIKRDPEPNGGGSEGWKLASLLDAAGVKKFDKLTLTGGAGTNLVLDKTDVSDKSIPFIKLNRQAKLRLRVYVKKGDGWTNAKDLKDLQRVDVK